MNGVWLIQGDKTTVSRMEMKDKVMARDYKVRVNFGGFIGAEEVYEVYATDEDDAIEQARELALDDCSFEIDEEDVEEED